jgi:hypothetical protein
MDHPGNTRFTALRQRYELAAQHYNDLKVQVGPQAAMLHTQQRFDVDARAVRVIACHEGRLPDDAELPGSVAW